MTYQERISALSRHINTAAQEVIAMYDEPLAAATVADGEQIPAETREDRHANIYDAYQAGIAYALLATAPDVDQLVDYIQYMAAQMRRNGSQWHEIHSAPSGPPQPPPLPADANTAGPWRDDARIIWSITPAAYFAALEQKETL